MRCGLHLAVVNSVHAERVGTRAGAVRLSYDEAHVLSDLLDPVRALSLAVQPQQRRGLR
jgi:hypothetical protein